MTLDQTIWICIAFCLGATQPVRGLSWERATASPIIQHEPFVVVWNLPTARCQERFEIPLPLEDFSIVENKGNLFRGQNMTIFYKNKFGLYPYISPEGEWHNAGIPQKVHLKEHLEKASKEITELLHHDFRGLAVVDWEEWRPLWRQNWGPKKVYREASEQWVRERFPGLFPEEQALLAELEFEEAARGLMESTLRLGRQLRPQGSWGFYRFPDCFNDNWEKEENYTGHCSPTEVKSNDQLMWLWKASSALYPSIYLPPKLPLSLRQHYIHHRLREALRVAQFGLKQPLPVIAYSRVSYRHSSRYLSEESCRSLRHYITTKLGPYVINVTRAARMCSHQLCHGNGRCVRWDPGELGAFLHLDPQLWETAFLDPDVSVWEQFQCVCYPGWAGTWCERPAWMESIKGPECNKAAWYYDLYGALHDNRIGTKSSNCPPIYEKKTELQNPSPQIQPFKQGQS
uniref:Hyaluronidase n=1 Tax=Varanus komodoensis TaxID=61221 RepID=A0A8D2LEN7_VARKO